MIQQKVKENNVQAQAAPQVIIFYGTDNKINVAAAPGMDRGKLLLLLGAANMSVLQTQTANGADAVIGETPDVGPIEVPPAEVQKQLLNGVRRTPTLVG